MSNCLSGAVKEMLERHGADRTCVFLIFRSKLIPFRVQDQRLLDFFHEALQGGEEQHAIHIPGGRLFVYRAWFCGRATWNPATPTLLAVWLLFVALGWGFSFFQNKMEAFPTALP